jgi:hypothetical protein
MINFGIDALRFLLPSKPLAYIDSIDIFFVWKALKHLYYPSASSMLQGLLNEILLH